MKKSKVLYRVITGLFCAFPAVAAVADVIIAPGAVKFMTGLGLHERMKAKTSTTYNS